MVVVTNQHCEAPEGWPNFVKYHPYTNSQADLDSTNYFAEWIVSLPTGNLTENPEHTDVSKITFGPAGMTLGELEKRNQDFPIRFMRATVKWLQLRNQTRKGYHREIKKFLHQCKADNYPCLVSPEVTEIYLENYLVSRMHSKDSTKTISASSVATALCAITSLYYFQREVGINPHSTPPRSDRTKHILKVALEHEKNGARNNPETRRSAFHRSGITMEDLKEVLPAALKGENESPFDRVLLTMGLYTLARGENIRTLQFADMFHTLDTEKHGPAESPKTALCFLSHNENGDKKVYGVLRHREADLCGVGALGLYLFEQFHILNHPFPLFFNLPLWVNNQLLVKKKTFDQGELKKWYEAAVEFMIKQAESPNQPLNFTANCQTAQVSFKHLNGWYIMLTTSCS